MQDHRLNVIIWCVHLLTEMRTCTHAWMLGVYYPKPRWPCKVRSAYDPQPLNTHKCTQHTLLMILPLYKPLGWWRVLGGVGRGKQKRVSVSSVCRKTEDSSQRGLMAAKARLSTNKVKPHWKRVTFSISQICVSACAIISFSTGQRVSGWRVELKNSG